MIDVVADLWVVGGAAVAPGHRVVQAQGAQVDLDGILAVAGARHRDDGRIHGHVQLQDHADLGLAALLQQLRQPLHKMQQGQASVPSRRPWMPGGTSCEKLSQFWQTPAPSDVLCGLSCNSGGGCTFSACLPPLEGCLPAGSSSRASPLGCSGSGCSASSRLM